MDIVIPHFDCTEQNYLEYILKSGVFQPLHKVTKPVRWSFNQLNMNFDYTEFYDYGIVKYILRGIEKYIPDVDNVYLLVNNIEQIPDYIDKTKVKIIFFRQFIPRQYVTPTDDIIRRSLNRMSKLLGHKISYIHNFIPLSSTYNSIKEVSITDIKGLDMNELADYDGLKITISKSTRCPLSQIERDINDKLNQLFPEKSKYENDR